MPQLLAAVGVVTSFGIAGCAATKTSNTGRTAMEQLLISNAIDRSLDKVDFRPLADRKVFLDTSYLDCVDKNYLIAATRARALQAGATVVPKAEEAELVVEVRSGGVGTDQSESYIGIPEVALPGPLPLAIPQIKFWSRSRQTGTAKLGLVAYDAKTHQILGSGGASLALADDSNTYFLGVGPYQSGSVREEVSEGVRKPRRYVAPNTIAFAPQPAGEPNPLRLAGGDDAAGRAKFESGESAPPPAPAAEAAP